ncbi:CARM1 [Branchiostoma lanceolatum]|uniref:Protein arginine N-methyltransferase n=1 Tax=Branchiostoma lanceolatum TaxID=7740 RepID=A0A8K0EXU8_BRALA|nr:CARM1 [Branchiostoma lanceolatum]
MARRDRVSVGRDLHYVPDITSSLESASNNGFDFVCSPIVHPRYKRECLEGRAKGRPGALSRSDLLLTSQDWSTLIVGKLSPWLQPDSEIESVRKNCEKALQQELSYAAHLSLPAILVQLRGTRCANLARYIHYHMMGHNNTLMWIQVPLQSPDVSREDVIEGEPAEDPEDNKSQDPWEWWNTFRSICHYHKKLALALELTPDLPSESQLRRWLGEPVRAAIIPTSIFLTNKKGYPVLSRTHQSFVQQLFKYDAQIVISGTARHGEKGLRAYQQYMEHLFQTNPQPDQVTLFARGYEDYLQCPLQPLFDNLESNTYETFEKDPVKYSQYQQAVYYALLDKIPVSEKDTKKIVLMVLGAGRGPLVRCSLEAAKRAERQIVVYAVEKNPNAVVTLEALKDEMWGEQVTVVSCDMREWEAPEKADIIVSELLGSFGDNELSPECLDGAQKFLKDDGISIPREYTSYIAPVSSHKLYNEVRGCKERDKGPEVSPGYCTSGCNKEFHSSLAPFETAYVVRLHNYCELAEPQPCFTFHHPNRGLIDNTRAKEFEFDIEENTVLNGFAGYFDTVLYGDVTLSIVPRTHSPGMFSWFSIFFPIREPIYLNKGSRLKVNFWRCCTEQKVWYEWCVNSPSVTPIHNPAGRSYTIGL